MSLGDISSRDVLTNSQLSVKLNAKFVRSLFKERREPEKSEKPFLLYNNIDI